MADNDAILEALQKTDDDGQPIFRADNDDAWTGNGAPKMELIEEILGDKSVTRKMVTEAAPQFTRDNPVLDLPEPQAEAEGADTEEQPEAPAEEATSSGLVEARDAASEAVDKAQKGLVEAQKVLSDAQAEFDAAETALKASTAHRTSQHDIMDFIKSQNEQRMARALAHNALIEKGLDMSAVGPAPIDKAMARKNDRGAQRPHRLPQQ